MPIRVEMRARHPDEWPQIRARILVRDKHCCAHCGVPNHVWVHRDAAGEILGQTMNQEIAQTWMVWLDEAAGHRVVRIVLTIAHLHDPDPGNCSDDNLAALCQRCHNVLDAPMRARNAYMTRRKCKAAGELF